MSSIIAWRVQAARQLRALADTGDRFTSDDLLERVGFPDEDHNPNARNNAIGALFREASRDRLIVAVGVAKSKVPTRKGGMVRVWRGADAFRAADAFRHERLL